MVPEEARPGNLTAESLAGITSFNDALALAQQEFGEVALADKELGDGFAILGTDAKNSLIGVPFIIMDAKQSNGDQGDFTILKLVTQEGNRKLILTDGSTGIHAQMTEWMEKNGKFRPLYVRHGLRVSNYMYTDDKGVEKPASTFYLDTSA